MCASLNRCTHTSVCMSIYEVIFPIQLVYETNSPVLILGIKSGDCGNLFMIVETLMWQQSTSDGFCRVKY